MLYACVSLSSSYLVLGFAMFGVLRGLDLVWLNSMLMRPCSNVTNWEEPPDAGLLHAYLSLFHSAQCYAYHVCLCHPLAFYASLNTCSHVHAWVLLASMSSMLQHNEVMGIQSKNTFVPRGQHLLFAFLLVCLLSCFFACHVYHVYLLYVSFICSLHLFLPSLVC